METNEHRLNLDLPMINQENLHQLITNNQTSTNGSNRITNEQIQQIIQILKNNSTTAFPFAFILILKSFYDHSAGFSFISH